ncbi:MAG TPA: hypothetical protein VLZ74_13655 [Methylocella sp.]|nr:hypothetical protein [Methylocella sp.]
MKTRRVKVRSAIAALTLGALAAYPAAIARADDTAEEIRLLKMRLKQLEEKVSKQDREQKAAEEKLRKAAAQQPGAPGNAPPIMVQSPVYSIPKIPGAPPQKPLEISLGVPAPPPSFENGGLVGLEAGLKGYPYVGPASLFINGVSITPGGFFELATVSRDKFIGAGIATPFQNIPFANIPSSHVGETHLEARRSRAALLVRGDVSNSLHLAGYGEFDWLSAAQTANLNQSDSFNLRIRHLYMQLDDDEWGAHLLAGHAFTLATMNIVGILPRTENTPLSIEDQYVPGFVWDRQDQIRLVKDFDQKLWFAVSVEQPATTFSGTAPTFPTVINVLPGVVGPPAGQGTVVGGSQYNSINPLSLNQMPDVIGKVAWDPTVFDRTIHMEGFGIFRNFVDRVVLPVTSLPGTSFINHNNDSVGDGVGGSILVPIIPKVVEAQFSGITGRGIGRYGAGQLADVTFRADGSLTAIPETMFLAGLVVHPWAGLDLYAYAGKETENANYGYAPLGGGFIGIGNPGFTNTGCAVELSTACSGNVREIESITGGFWQDILKGPFGRLTGGVEYMYAKKYGFQGVGGEPSRDENMFYTSLRYYPF